MQRKTFFFKILTPIMVAYIVLYILNNQMGFDIPATIMIFGMLVWSLVMAIYTFFRPKRGVIEMLISAVASYLAAWSIHDLWTGSVSLFGSIQNHTLVICITLLIVSTCLFLRYGMKWKLKEDSH